MVELKTGSLIEGAVKAGAVGAGASPEHVAHIGRLGRDLGVAFQIIDDSLDLLGGTCAQKSIMNDMKQGKATPMIIYALKKANKEEKEKILRAAGIPMLPEQWQQRSWISTENTRPSLMLRNSVSSMWKGLKKNWLNYLPVWPVINLVIF